MTAPTVPALTSALVTRLAKPAAPDLRWSSERAANGSRLVRVWDSPQEIRDLNTARDLIRAVGLTASVVALRSRGGRTQFRVLVTSKPEEAARLADAAARRAAALEAARTEVAAADARRAVLADTAAHYQAMADEATAAESPLLAARRASEAAWEEEAHAAGFATGADYGEYLVAETVDVPQDSPEPAPAPSVDGRVAVPYFPYAVPPEEVSGALPGVASTDSHRSPAPATIPCYHVTTVRGEVYGVAATSVRDALQMVQDRLAGEEPGGDLPKGARKVGRWAAAYGTVLHY